MKKLLKNFCVAFSLYTKIPMPKMPWTTENMQYALAYLPCIGLLIGAFSFVWLALAQQLMLSAGLYAVVAVLLPVLLTGGIHLDGFADTSDALCSYGDREKKLEILKDPHIGAFGVIYITAVLLLQTGLYMQLYDTPNTAKLLLVLFASARVIGAGAIVYLPCAKQLGLAKTFADGSNKKTVRMLFAVQGVLCLGAVFWIRAYLAVIGLVLLVCLLPIFTRLCKNTFGGITGDLAGFSITCTETLLLVLCVIGGVIERG